MITFFLSQARGVAYRDFPARNMSTGSISSALLGDVFEVISTERTSQSEIWVKVRHLGKRQQQSSPVQDKGHRIRLGFLPLRDIK